MVGGAVLALSPQIVKRIYRNPARRVNSSVTPDRNQVAMIQSLQLCYDA